MLTKPWTKTQAKNNKKFQAKLERITNYIIAGDWQGSYGSETNAENDGITNFVSTKDSLPLATLKFSRHPGGALLATEAGLDESGKPIKEEFVVALQPFEGTFYMLSIDDNDTVFGSVCRKSGVITTTALETKEPGDEARLEIFQYTNLSL